MVMRRVEGVGDYMPRHYRGTLKRGRLTQHSIFNFQFAVRIAASVALLLLVGFFFMLRQPASVEGSTYCKVHNMDEYRIDLSQIPTDGTPRDMYRCYQEAKREQTFYHNELIKYTHENM